MCWSWTDISFFPGRSRHCPQCRKRTVKTKKGNVTEYYHEGVVCSFVDDNMAIPLDVEMMRPGEGEVRAAHTLIKRVLKRYNRMVDLIVADAIYLQAPFLNFCLDRGKNVVAVLKKNNPDLLQETRSLQQKQPTACWQTPDKTIRAWDIPDIETDTNIKKKLRVVHTQETRKSNKHNREQLDYKDTTSQWYWATTISEDFVSTEALCEIAHRRWDIENKVFNTLANHWGLNHCYKHHPVAIINFIITLFITFILVQVFYQRNLKPQIRRIYTTLISITDAFLAQLLQSSTPQGLHRTHRTAPT